MTFAAQMEKDLDVFFNVDEFAGIATYTPAGGTSISINICLDEYDPGISDIAPGDEMLILVKSSEVVPKRGDTFIIAGDTWYFLEVLNSDFDVLKLKLSRSEIRRM